MGSLIDAVLRFVDEGGYSDVTQRRYRRILSEFAFWVMKEGDEDGKRLSKGLIERYCRLLRDRGLGRANMLQHSAALRSFLRWYGQEGLAEAVQSETHHESRQRKTERGEMEVDGCQLEAMLILEGERAITEGEHRGWLERFVALRRVLIGWLWLLYFMSPERIAQMEVGDERKYEALGSGHADRLRQLWDKYEAWRIELGHERILWVNTRGQRMKASSIRREIDRLRLQMKLAGQYRRIRVRMDARMWERYVRAARNQREWFYRMRESLIACLHMHGLKASEIARVQFRDLYLPKHSVYVDQQAITIGDEWTWIWGEVEKYRQYLLEQNGEPCRLISKHNGEPIDLTHAHVALWRLSLSQHPDDNLRKTSQRRNK